MKKYTYIDYIQDRKVFFECEADSILEADAKLLEATGVVASKRNDIGCIPQDEVKNEATIDSPRMK